MKKLIHGRADTYRRLKCRCPECREAHRLSMREYRIGKGKRR